MRISVKVKPSAKQEKVEKVGKNNFTVWVKERPFEGRANRAAADILAEYFSVPKSQVVLVKGGTSKNKIFEII